MEPNMWTRCATGTCVEAKWLSACSSGGCVEVGRDGDRVLVRDSKLGDESPVIEFTPSGWRGFVDVATEWDRDSEVHVGGVCLDRIGGDYPVCILSCDPVALHFSWEEWDAFVEGVKGGKFDLGGVPK